MTSSLNYWLTFHRPSHQIIVQPSQLWGKGLPAVVRLQTFSPQISPPADKLVAESTTTDRSVCTICNAILDHRLRAEYVRFIILNLLGIILMDPLSFIRHRKAIVTIPV